MKSEKTKRRVHCKLTLSQAKDFENAKKDMFYRAFGISGVFFKLQFSKYFKIIPQVPKVTQK